MAGGNITQLKEQVEANHAVLEAAIKEIEGKNDQLGVRQEELEVKMNALQATFTREFNWLRKQLDPGGEAVSGEQPPSDPKYKGILNTPVGIANKDEEKLKASGSGAGNGYGGGFVVFNIAQGAPNNFKQPRYEFPTYDGDDDVLDWLQQCDCFFFINETPMHQQVSTMSLYLKGKARKWFFTRYKNHRALRWEQFKTEVTKRFTAQGYHNVIAELHDLKQVGGVEEYQSRFEDLKSQVLEK